MIPRIRFQLSPHQHVSLQSSHLATLSWALARALDADFVLTVADQHPDHQRWLEENLDDLEWLGLDWDEGPRTNGELGETRQSARLSQYQAVYDELSQTAVFPQPLIDENGRFHPTFTTLIDDKTFQITHVATYDAAQSEMEPLLYEHLGWEPPTRILLHAPMNLPSNLNLTRLQEDGYLPKAIFHYLLLLSWQPEQQYETLDKWIVRKHFARSALRTAPVPFEFKALKNINHRYIQNLSVKAVAEIIRPFLEDAYDYVPTASGWLERVTTLIKPSLTTLEEAVDLAVWALSDDVWLDDAAKTAVSTPQARALLTQLVAEVAAVVLLDEQTAAAILQGVQRRLELDDAVLETAVSSALTGQPSSVSPASLMSILGKQRTLQRFGAAVA